MRPDRKPSKIEVILHREPLLSGQQQQEQQQKQHHDQKLTPKSILRRCRSAPASDCVPTPKSMSPKPIFGMPAAINPTGKAALILLIYLSAGILCFIHIKDQLRGTKTLSFVDALYFCVVTMTTVGYGDLVPATTYSKLLTCLFVLVGFVIFGLLLGHAANYLVEKQGRLLERAIEKREEYLHHHSTSDHKMQQVHCKLAVAALAILVLFGVGTLVLIKVEGFGFVDAFYCICVTVTTLGYGDRSFTTTGGRIFAVFWILVSTVSVAQFVLYIAELVTEGRQHTLTKWVISRKITYSEFEAADLDDDGALSIAEFMVYKLKEMGKLEEDDVAAIIKQFQELDVDGSGSITIGDINFAQLNGG